MKKLILSALLISLIAAGCNKQLSPTETLQDNNDQKAYALLNQLLVQYSPQSNLNLFAIKNILASPSGQKNIVEFGPQNSAQVTGLYSVTGQAMNADYIIVGDGQGGSKITDVAWHGNDYATYQIEDAQSGNVIAKSVLYAYDQPRKEAQFTKLFAANSSLDLYDGYALMNGVVNVNTKTSQACFTSDAQSLKKLPAGSHASFCFSNYAQALELLHVPNNALKGLNNCQTSTNASGYIEGYMLATNPNGQDYARLDRVTSIGDWNLKNCR